MKNSLGIIGGVGPLASSYLYEMITKQTKADKDQEHLDIILLSHASIPDRTAYILDHSKENPFPYLLADCQLLEKLGAKMIVIPCNTSCYFHQQLQKEIKIPINNMIQDTVNYISKKGIKHVAILATTGTIESKLYQNELDKHHIHYILPDQKKVMNIIYNYIKANRSIDKSLWDELINDMQTEAYILGCTELSVIKKELKLTDEFIDPLEIETQIILNFFEKQKSERM